MSPSSNVTFEPVGSSSFGADAGLEINADGVGLCFGCRAVGQCHLGVTAEGLESDGTFWQQVQCPSTRQGARGVAHGGWTADLFDEALGKQIARSGQFGVTRRLDVEYFRPVPVETPLELVAIRTAEIGDRVEVEAELRLADGAPLAKGTGEFVLREGDEHFARFRAWRDS